MESNEKMQNAKKEFDQIAENETANFKITLLEKHLMESREAHLELKQQELELRDKQLAVIADMQKANEEAKAIDQKLVDKIDESVQSIKTEMFETWQETVRDALVAETKALVENKLSEYDTIYRKQNEVIGAQAKLIDKLTTSYRFMKLLCSALVIVAILVFAVIPTGQYAFEEIGKFLSEPTWWGGVVLAAAVILLSLAVALAVLLRRKEAKK